VCSEGQACNGGICISAGGIDAGGGDMCAQRHCNTVLDCWANGCFTACTLTPAKLTAVGYCR
jgi:hypothetical protein